MLHYQSGSIDHPTFESISLYILSKCGPCEWWPMWIGALTIESNCGENILNFKLIFNDKKLFKIRFLPHVGSKIYEITSKKSLSLNPHQRLSNHTKSMTWDIMVWEISKWQTKQTTKPSLIDIYLLWSWGCYTNFSKDHLVMPSDYHMYKCFHTNNYGLGNWQKTNIGWLEALNIFNNW
jgi:hypothetical protein